MEQSIIELRKKMNSPSTTVLEPDVKKRQDKTRLDYKIAHTQMKLHKSLNSSAKSSPKLNKNLTQKQVQSPRNFFSVSLQVQKLKDSKATVDSANKPAMVSEEACQTSLLHLNDSPMTQSHPPTTDQILQKSGGSRQTSSQKLNDLPVTQGLSTETDQTLQKSVGASQTKKLTNSQDYYINPSDQFSSPLTPAHNNQYIITQAQVTAVKIHINKKKSLFLLGVYRPPCADLDTSLQVLADALDSLPTQRNDTLIMGDINIDSLDEASRESVALNALLAGYNMLQHKHLLKSSGFVRSTNIGLMKSITGYGIVFLCL
ncbi:hypothetical protein J6590_028402 [Homalodisca vitripennis]|nr:hypothetical protein J6590_028402 [Homalodisca vitripennis]